MKKFLALCLAVMMVLSTVSFAAPSMADTVLDVTETVTEESTVVEEATQETAELSAEANYGQLIAKIDFEDVDLGTKFIRNDNVAKQYSLYDIGYIAENLPENFPENITLQLYANTTIEVCEDTDGNRYGKYVVEKAAGYPKLVLNGANANHTAEMPFPEGSYTLKTTYTVVSKTDLEGTTTNPTSHESGITVVPFFKNNSGATFTNERYDSKANSAVISSSSKNGKVYNVIGTTTYSNNCDVQYRSNTPVFKFGGYSGFTTMLSIDPNTANERIYNVDNIELYYKPVEDVVNVEFYDLRKGYMDITLKNALPEITTIAQARAAFLKTTDLFDAGLDIITNEDGTTTYRLYEDAYLNGKAVELNRVYRGGDTAILLSHPTVSTTHLYKSIDMNEYDGENMVVNGDFENYYYTGTVKEKTNSNISIDDKGLLFTATDKATQRWNTQSLQPIPLETAKYFVELDIEHVSNSTEDVDGSYTIALYLPFPSNNGNFSIGGSYYSSPAHIPSSASLGKPQAYSISVNEMDTNKKFSYKRVLDLTGLVDGAEKYDPGRATEKDFPVADLPKIPLSFQVVYDASATGFAKDYSKAAGTSFRINKLSFKKMFEAKFTDGETTDVLDVAKDVEFILPSKLGTKNVSAWIDENGNKYPAGALFTPEEYVAEGIAFTAVDEYIPYNEEKTSIRFGENSGIRFLASVTNAQRETLDEYGFVVTRKVILDSYNLDNDALAFDAGFPVVSGAAYDKVGNIDKIFETNNFGVFFTGVVTGVPENMYNDQLVVRPYAKKDGVYYYGEVSQSSIMDVMKKIRDDGYTSVSEEQARICKQILIKNGEYTEETEEGYVMFEDDVEDGNWFGMTKGYNCTLTIAEDPTDSENHVYFITNRDDEDNSEDGLHAYIWTSANHLFKIEENASYCFTADVYIPDKNMAGNTITNAVFSGAFGFTGTGKTFKHNINSTAYPNTWTQISKAGKLSYTGTNSDTAKNWTMEEFTYADTNSGIEVIPVNFGIYTNPKDGYGVSFYVDNIKLIKLK